MKISMGSVRRLDEPSPDSRFYIFAFSIRSPAELPLDFEIPAEYRSFEYGVFLPRDDPDWFGRSSRPARVLLLSGITLILVTHPRAKEPVRALGVKDLQFIEYGHILLQGWLRFVAADSVFVLPFNTASSRPVESFLSVVWDRYAPSEKIGDGSEISFHGAELDIKFRNAEQAALQPNERIAARCFIPPRSRKRGFWPFGFETWEGGDCVWVSDRRMAWISDRNRGMYERYGSILRAAPAGNVTGVSLEGAEPDCRLTCRLAGGTAWRIPVPSEHREAAQQFRDWLKANILSGDHT